MPVALDDLGADRVHLQGPSSAMTCASISGAELAVRSHRPGQLADRQIAGRATQGDRDPDRSSNAHVASFRPSVIGSAWTEWVRPIITVSACSRAFASERRDELIHLHQQQVRRVAALERQRGVDHVARRQAEVDEAAFLAHRLGDLADEGDHVVVGRLLQLGDPLDVDAARCSSIAATCPRGTCPRGSTARSAAISTRSMLSKCA